MAKNKQKPNLKLLHKREQAMLDIAAPRLIPQKQIILPLTNITQDTKLKPITKLIYGELYTIFNVINKVQLNHKALEKPVNAKHLDVVHALKYLAKLGLIQIVSVRDSSQRNHVIGHIIIDTGLNKSSNHLDKVLDETDYQQNLRKIRLEHIGKMALQYLNQKVHRHWRFSNKRTHRNIMARLHEGYTYLEFKKVVDNMYTLWHNNPKMSQYLRPSTLFGTKFDTYLNEVIKRQPTNQKQVNRQQNQGGSLNKYEW